MNGTPAACTWSCWDRGRLETPSVVCAAGTWSSMIGTWVGVDLPARPPARRIVVTEPVHRLGPATPSTIDLSTSFYFHHEGRGLLIGKDESQDVWGHDLSPAPGQPD